MINPNDAPLRTPLWCVYGPTSFPTIFCCMINDIPGHGRGIWGYSVYQRSPGFRTLGQSLSWATQHDAKFFLTQEEALKYLSGLITPKKSAVDKL